MSPGSEAMPFAGLSDADAELAAILAIGHLTDVGVSRARWLMSEHEPVAAFELLRAGRPPVSAPPPNPLSNQRARLEQWSAQAREIDPVELLTRYRAHPGLTLLSPSHPAWPFASDPEPPTLLFALGDVELLGHAPRVAVVGTRRCSTVGTKVAIELGRELAAAGVPVVSGLALGIDAAAHRGAGPGPAPRIAVVGTGLDVPYPRRNRALWDEIARTGVVLSEAPLGSGPDRWRFPARNRLIAGLASALVVVESHEAGGSLITVDEAIVRGVDVLAVPGSVLSSSSHGTNQLLVDGCQPVRGAADVLGAIGMSELEVATQPRLFEEPSDPLQQAVLAETTNGPTHIDSLVGLTGAPVGSVLLAVQELASLGVVTVEGSLVQVSSGGEG